MVSSLIPPATAILQVFTMDGAAQAAHDNGKEIMVDLLCVSDMERTISLCERTGADYVCVHCGVDMQESPSGSPQWPARAQQWDVP